MTHTLVSYNRPLTRSARKALEPYNIQSVEPVEELNRWTLVTVEELPPEELREQHELRLDREPVAEYETPNGEAVAIYRDPNKVAVDGVEATLSPDEAISRAESYGWDEK